MATVVCFHAHPGDEAVATGGMIAKAKADGHQVFVVFATRGEQIPPVAGIDEGLEALASRREREANAAAAALGVDGLAFLGYGDAGPARHDAPSTEAFAQVEIDRAAAQVAAVCADVGADALVIDGPRPPGDHLDHQRAHRVGQRAVHLADPIRCLWVMARPGRPSAGEAAPGVEREAFGLDVTSCLPAKRTAIECYASYRDDVAFFGALSEERFAGLFGIEWFVEPGGNGDPNLAVDLFAS